MMLYKELQASIKASFQLRRDLILFRTPQYPCVYADSLPEIKTQCIFFSCVLYHDKPQTPLFPVLATE